MRCTKTGRTCTQVTTPSFRSRCWIICRLHGGCACGQASPQWIMIRLSISTRFMPAYLPLALRPAVQQTMES